MTITINGSGDINATGNDIELNSTGTTDVTLAVGGGSVGVGTASPTTKGHFYSTTSMDQLSVDGAGAIETGINFKSGGTTYGQIHFNNVSPYDMSIMQQYSTGSLIFGTNDTEVGRFDSSGNFKVSNGTIYLDDNGSHNGVINAPASLFVNIDSDSTSSGEDFIIGSDRTGTSGGKELLRMAGGEALTLTNTKTGVTSSAMVFSNAVSGGAYRVRFDANSSIIGDIKVTTSSVSYNTTSDARLKENVVDLDGAIDRVKQIPVHRFNFIVDPDNTVDGFLAHEVQSVVPEAVSGTQNEVDDEGNPIYQGIDQSKVVPLLTAALKDAITKIETLETANADMLARIEALEAV